MTEMAKNIRKKILEISCKVKSAHIGSNLSCADIFSALYFNILNLENFEKRDIFILSKAHSALALYVSLYYKGLMSEENLHKYYINGGLLPAHTDRKTNNYVEISAGSLGHGLPIAVGLALALKAQKRKVFCLMGDGEIQEGSVWEAAMLSSNLKLNNLICLVDYNNLQGYQNTKELLEPLDNKWKSFGYECVSIDGHNEKELIKAIKDYENTQKPLCIICKTTKGKGVSFMENKLEWHYYSLSNDEYKKALEELK